MAKDNCIFVGGKPFMNYVTGIVMQFTTKNAKEVTIKARGKKPAMPNDTTKPAKTFSNV